ncbi:hypothetical protein AG1IA_07116 [Rhizoctonia solani AG-1 IA]|uniref:DUF7025 domain-containing protein n=1 Tax=Thanatephorus cucumeris (strain AG1-IA) TaxID=983506 RepID=L8WLP5_THACA|nr:hypothetical protein AG1IA_07116 [Rhizoctonia solani AG-1 IA]
MVRSKDQLGFNEAGFKVSKPLEYYWTTRVERLCESGMHRRASCPGSLYIIALFGSWQIYYLYTLVLLVSTTMPIIRRGQDVTSRSYYACLDQSRDPYTYGNWANVPVDGQIGTRHRNLVFEAHNRIHSPTGSNSLANGYFRSHEALKGVESLEYVNSGIDARDIFLRLEALKVSAIEPIFELEEEEPTTVGLGLGWPPSPVPMLPINFATHSQDQFPSPPRSIVSPPGITHPPPMNSYPSSRNSYSPVFFHTKPPLTVPEQLWVLLDFIESHFKETVEELERLRSGGDISYNLLWTLCIPGHLVETKDTATGLPIGMRLQSWDYGHDGTKFTIWGDTYMWDGKLFKREIISVEIEHFKGIMKLDELPIKPLTDQCKQSLIGSYAYTLSCSTGIDKHGFCVERGRLYQKYAGIHHLNYDAAITVSTEYSTIQLPAKGRVMLDAGGYSRYNSNNSREHQGPTWDPYPLRSPLPGPVRSPLRSDDEYKNDNPLPDEILCLTPPAHKAWSFAAEAWGDVLVNNLSEITFDKLALDQLVLKTDQKKLLKALVESHSGGNKLAMDARPGKNGGLTMVLHGNPAVSEHLKCPLYVVSSGELGTEADELEKKLRSIFEMIAAWGAALLINEANLIATLYASCAPFCEPSNIVKAVGAKKHYFNRLFMSYATFNTTCQANLNRNPSPRSRSSIEVTNLEGESYITHEELGSLAKQPIDACAIGQIIRGAQALSISDMEPLRMPHVGPVLMAGIVAEQFEADSKELELTEDTTARKEGCHVVTSVLASPFFLAAFHFHLPPLLPSPLRVFSRPPHHSLGAVLDCPPTSLHLRSGVPRLPIREHCVQVSKLTVDHIVSTKESPAGPTGKKFFVSHLLGYKENTFRIPPSIGERHIWTRIDRSEGLLQTATRGFNCILKPRHPKAYKSEQRLGGKGLPC